MLPSKGYFKALECPYFAGSSCDRPYCHFKHSRQDYPTDSDRRPAAGEAENDVNPAAPDPTRSDASPDEPRPKPKAKSKVIEYVPQCVRAKKPDSANATGVDGSAAETAAKDAPLPEYVPSRVDGAAFKFEYLPLESGGEPIDYTDGLSTSYSVGERKTDISEYTPAAVEKPTAPKTVEHEDGHREHHGSASKRKHEPSKKTSRSSSSSSSSRSKRPKRDESPERKKDRKENSKSEKQCSKDKKSKSSKRVEPDGVVCATVPGGPRSLKEAVFEKVKKKLVVPDTVKTDLSCSSDEGKGPSVASIEADLIEFFGSEDSGCEQNEPKPCASIVEAKVKKRISHISSTSIFAQINACPVSRPKTSKSLHEMVASRVQSIQNNATVPCLPKKPPMSSNLDPSLPLLKIKARVAHQPKLEPVSTDCRPTNNSKVDTKEITNDVKLNLRIKSFKSSNNMPNPLRQSCLEKLYTAYANHYSSEEAISRALTTEEEVHVKAKSSGIYRNLIVQSLMKANKSPEIQVKSNPYYPSHMFGVCLYELLKKYILSRDELEKNGYPLMGDNKLAYISKNAYYYRPLSKKRNGNKYICMNCKSEFEVDKRGMPTVTLSKCIYHSGKLKFDRSKNEKFWLCCYQRQHESGCESSIYHIPDKLDDDALENFVVTNNIKSNGKPEEPNFYALDCEMVSTTVGIEIVRVTVINHEGEVVYESKVKPRNPILDYKSKYSGITEECLKHCKKKLCDVQHDLLKLFDKNSILIGHSLDSDLKALKMIHYNVVDTSIIYPHKYGPPYKWGLKLLSEQYLQRIIQSEEGHDSKEDALASLDLVWKKLKEDVKKFKPVNIISIDNK